MRVAARGVRDEHLDAPQTLHASGSVHAIARASQPARTVQVPTERPRRAVFTDENAVIRPERDRAHRSLERAPRERRRLARRRRLSRESALPHRTVTVERDHDPSVADFYRRNVSRVPTSPLEPFVPDERASQPTVSRRHPHGVPRARARHRSAQPRVHDVDVPSNDPSAHAREVHPPSDDHREPPAARDDVPELERVQSLELTRALARAIARGRRRARGRAPEPSDVAPRSGHAGDAPACADGGRTKGQKVSLRVSAAGRRSERT